MIITANKAFHISQDLREQLRVATRLNKESQIRFLEAWIGALSSGHDVEIPDNVYNNFYR